MRALQALDQIEAFIVRYHPLYQSVMHMSLKLIQQLPSCTPPWEGPGKSIEKLTRKAIYEFDLLEDSVHIGVALSGGKDSLTLLFMLNAISGRGFQKFKITALHVSGAFSCGASIETAYIKKICQHLEIDLEILHSDQTLENLQCYSCSRERRKLIFRKAKDLGINKIAFGHHLDDHIETFMLNLVQKGQVEGNLPKVPMILYGVTIIRPLIFVEEKDIIEFSKAAEFARIMCQCPVGQNSKRKKTKDLIRSIQSEFPHVKSNLAKAGLDFGSKKALRQDLLQTVNPSQSS